ncbi:MAG: 5-formyltetrahydrofolate cyclo-ligase [Nitrospina sp.]|nr:MAG: 5-formyltetrahydrofolate cyclo-ligase [Nitrospina sp.]
MKVETVALEVPSPVEDALSDKATVRQEILSRRDALDPETVQRQSALIAGHLESLGVYQKSAAVLFYLSKKNEVQTDGMIATAIRSGKRVYVPVTGPDEIKVSELPGLDIEFDLGLYGIRQPAQRFLKFVAPGVLDLVILPGVAFDVQGGRIGYGKGYFDRFLGKLATHTVRVGVAYEFQVLETVPQTGMDVAVQKIVTENSILNC